eukprot:452587-Pyramimonas_sp.AAC.1
MRGNLLFLTNTPYREVQLVSKNGCIGRCVKPLRACGGMALTSLMPTGRRRGSMFRIQIHHRTTPIGSVMCQHSSVVRLAIRRLLIALQQRQWII